MRYKWFFHESLVQAKSQKPKKRLKSQLINFIINIEIYVILKIDSYLSLLTQKIRNLLLKSNAIIQLPCTHQIFSFYSFTIFSSISVVSVKILIPWRAILALHCRTNLQVTQVTTKLPLYPSLRSLSIF